MSDNTGVSYDEESFDAFLEAASKAEVVGSFLDVVDGKLTDEVKKEAGSSTVARRRLQPLISFMQGEMSEEWFGPAVPPLPPVLGEVDKKNFHSVVHLISDIHLDNRDGMTGWFSSSRKGPFRLFRDAVNWLRRDARSHATRFPEVTPKLRIVGDLFDIWQGCARTDFQISRKNQIANYRAALLKIGKENHMPLRALQAYAKDGNKVAYTIGNHDMDVIKNGLENVAREVVGIKDMDIGEAFIERRLNMIGLHGHQADQYNAAKTVRGRWAPGEVLMRNAINDWQRWSSATAANNNLRMFALSLNPVTDGVMAIDTLVEFDRMKNSEEAKLVYLMANALIDGEVLSKREGKLLLFTLNNITANLPTNGLSFAMAVGVFVRTLSHLVSSNSGLVLDGDILSENSTSRRMFRRIYTPDKYGKPESFQDSGISVSNPITMPLSTQMELHLAAKAMGATVSVAGHTHTPELSGDQSHVYLNTGSWCDRWRLGSNKVFGMESIRPAYNVSTISRVYKLYVGKGVHDIVVEVFQFDGAPRLRARRRLRVRYK